MKTNKILYQWDAGQKLTDCKGVFVDFVISGDVYRCDVVNGECIVPDELLQHPGKQTAYECMADNTLQEFVFSVVPRPLPPDYVYTPTEKLTFEGLVQKVNDTVADIIRRADSGEFDGYTPVKGKDYFTEAEKDEMVESVSSGAIGEFREVVNNATADFNKNSSAKTNDYNTNAEQKLDVYNSNAAEKLKAYNDNHVEKMTAYDTNATDKLSTYNRNAEQKLEAYNQNHTEKVSEYNANAETKTAEFDANAAALQTEVDRLRGECDQLAAENRKQENRISALMKLNKGQTYDILPEEGESASRTAPSGAKYVSVDKVGGKSLVWNQLFNISQNKRVDGGQFEINFESQTVTLNGNSGNNAWLSVTPDYGKIKALNAKNHQYIYVISVVENQCAESVTFGWLNRARHSTSIPANYTGRANFVCTVTKPEEGKSIGFSGLQPNTDYALKIVLTACDLTLLFGAGNEPTAEQFEAMFPAESYPYNPGEIISSRTETITAGAEAITTGFPELRSALEAHDCIDMDGGKIHRKIKSTRIDGNTPIYSVRTDQDNCCRVVFTPETSPGIVISEEPTIPTNIISDKLATITHNNYWSADAYTGIEAYPGYASISMRLQDRTDLDTKEKVSAWIADNPMTVYYEAKDDDIADIVVPEQLREWIEVETGSTVVFGDDTRFLIPNTVKFVRKLNEVT